jgi:tetratricopeptide (TPR) repeat protein
MDAEYLLKRVGATTPLTPLQMAIQCWCEFVQGMVTRDLDKLNVVGQRYQALAVFPGFDGAAPSGISAAAVCFASAANWSAAADAATGWTAESPEDALAMRKLAEARYKLNEIPKAIQAFEKYLQLREEGDDDWQASLLLRLGLEAGMQDSLTAKLEAAALSASIRPQAERLIAWSHRWFDSLSPKAKERWWVGVYLLSSPHVAEDIGDARWYKAAAAFGEAVALELKADVFVPFAASSQVTQPKGYWKLALECRATLGQMIECLIQSTTPSDSTAKMLGEWLSANRQGLWVKLRTDSAEQLRQVSRLRGDAAHDSVTEYETREVYDLAIEWFEALAGGAPPKTGSPS